MNLAVPFMRNFKYLNDENLQLNIKYRPKIKALNDFIQCYKNHRINIYIEDKLKESDFEILKALKETFPESKIVYCFPYYSPSLEQQLNEKNIIHYYSELVTDWDTFNGFLSLNVTDIFIGENICFYLEDLSQKAKNKNIALRTFCNVCQSPWENTSSLKTFFIRPEDINLYSKYIDTFEFFFDSINIHKLNVLYEVYVKNKKWFGLLNEIIFDYKGQEDNRFIISYFGEKRINCKKRCSYEANTTCHICDNIIDLSKTLKDKGLIVSIEEVDNGTE